MKRIFRLSIRKKIFLFAILPLATTTLLSFYVHYVSENKQITGQVNKLMISELRSLRKLIDIELKSIRTIAFFGAEFVQFSDEIRMDEALPYLSKNLDKSEFIVDSRFAFDPKENKGKRFLASVALNGKDIIYFTDTLLIDYTAENELWYNVPRITLRPYWDLPYYDRVLKKLVSRVSVPIIKNDRFYGVSAITFDLQKFRDIKTDSLHKFYPFVVLSEDGNFIIHPTTKKMVEHESIFTQSI